MKQFFLKFFTWWNGQTFGTQLWTKRYGELVGQDEQGNLYYRTRGGAIDPALGFERRWVIYNGYAVASRIPTGWHGWMHHVVDAQLTHYSWTRLMADVTGTQCLGAGCTAADAKKAFELP